MQPYQKYSFEELRAGDYNQGRRYGNGSGQAGAFGTPAFGGGGFGQQNTSTAFGSTTTPFGGGGTSAPAAFGQTQTSNNAFGSTTSNPLFGATKPNSVFTGTSAPAQSGLFGNTAGAGNFGNTGAGAFGTSGPLFGASNNNQQQQSKPLFGSTGNTGFGSTFGQQSSAATSNPFGATASATTTPFGGQQQTGTPAFGAFGQNQNQNQSKPLFGGLNTGNQQPQGGGGLFGNPNTGGGLFGQNNQQQQNTGSIFGNSAQQPNTGPLFGTGNQQQEQKPLFGNVASTSTNAGTTPFSAFGNNQNQQTGGSNLFNNTQNQQQQKPSIFANANTSGSLFQNTTSQNTAGSIFGNNQNPQQTGAFGSSNLFNSTQQNSQQQPQQQQPIPGSLQASLLDGNPYGNQSIFSGLPPNAPSPGPLATPLSASMKQKQRTPLPVYKLTPSAANRLITPPRRQGYGFSYSSYGTPPSASYVSALSGSILGGSLRGGNLGGSFGRSFGKSFSTSNLRKTFDPDSDSLLVPGALTGSGSRYSSNSLKRLTIDRSLRNDLFSKPLPVMAPTTTGDEAAQQGDKSKKRVSFDSRPSQDQSDEANGALVLVSTEPSASTHETVDSSLANGHVNGVNESATSSETAASTESHMEKVRGNELAIVPEHSEQPAEDGQSKLPFLPPGDPQPGDYWMKPSRAELSKMTRDQLKRVENFTVGRAKCGQVTFDQPVDLTTVDLDQVFGSIVKITVRSITVYTDDVQKPPVGKGLNVPSTLRIENSWPRGRDKKVPSPITSGPLYEKHVERLRRINTTEFVTYEKDTGVWIFKVPHFTTYGFDYEDDEGESLNQSTLSDAPDTPTPKARTPSYPSPGDTFNSEQTTSFSIDDSFVGSMAGVDDDTFDFKKRKMVPGAFVGNQMEAIEDEDMESEDEEGSFLEDGSTGTSTEQDVEGEVTGDQQSMGDEDEKMSMAGTFPAYQSVEYKNAVDATYNDRTRHPVRPGTPTKPGLDLAGDWTDQLQRTISPRKQDRNVLREIQANAFLNRKLQEDSPKVSSADKQQRGFTTSIDLMNSLFRQPQKHEKSPMNRQNVQDKGFEV